MASPSSPDQDEVSSQPRSRSTSLSSINTDIESFLETRRPLTKANTRTEAGNTDGCQLVLQTYLPHAKFDKETRQSEDGASATSDPDPEPTRHPESMVMPEKARVEFDKETEDRRRDMRALSKAHREVDGDLSRKIPIAQEASPITVTGPDERPAQVQIETAQEEAQARMKMEPKDDSVPGMSNCGDGLNADGRGPPSPPRSDKTVEEPSPLLVDAILEATQKPGRAKVRDISQLLRNTIADRY